MHCQQWIARLLGLLASVTTQELHSLLQSMQETLAACSLWSDDKAARMDHLATVDLQLHSVADVRTQASMIMEKYETLSGMEVFVLSQFLLQGFETETQ